MHGKGLVFRMAKNPVNVCIQQTLVSLMVRARNLGNLYIPGFKVSYAFMGSEHDV